MLGKGKNLLNTHISHSYGQSTRDPRRTSARYGEWGVREEREKGRRKELVKHQVGERKT